MQLQADALNAPIAVSENPQITALGVGLMAGLGAGFWTWVDGLPESSRVAAVYEPSPDRVDVCTSRYERWRAVCLEIAGWVETMQPV
jgi:glycerol kinase